MVSPSARLWRPRRSCLSATGASDEPLPVIPVNPLPRPIVPLGMGWVCEVKRDPCSITEWRGADMPMSPTKAPPARCYSGYSSEP